MRYPSRVQGEKDVQLGALRIFVAVAEAETLTDAARTLGITQSAVSQAIALLERMSRDELVLRRSRPVKLTPSGVILYEHARDILAATRRMVAAVQSAGERGLRELRIGLIDSFGDAAATRLVQRVDPLAAQLSLQTGFNAPLSQAFMQRELDVLITSDPLEDGADLERHALLRDPFVMLVAAEHSGENTAPGELADRLPFVRYPRHSRLGTLTDLIARRLKISPSARYVLDSTQTLLRFVQSGQAWSMTTALCIARYPELLKGVRVLPLANSANARYISLLARHNELGTLPAEMATICRQIMDDDVVPRIVELAPFLRGEARSIEETPII